MQVSFDDRVMTVVTGENEIAIAKVGKAWVAVVICPDRTETFTDVADADEARAFVRILNRLVGEGYLTDQQADIIAKSHPVLVGWVCRTHPRHFRTDAICPLCTAK